MLTRKRKWRQRSRILRLGLEAERSETAGRWEEVRVLAEPLCPSPPALVLLRAGPSSKLVVGVGGRLLGDLADGDDAAPVRRTCSFITALASAGLCKQLLITCPQECVLQSHAVVTFFVVPGMLALTLAFNHR